MMSESPGVQSVQGKEEVQLGHSAWVEGPRAAGLGWAWGNRAASGKGQSSLGAGGWGSSRGPHLKRWIPTISHQAGRSTAAHLGSVLVRKGAVSVQPTRTSCPGPGPRAAWLQSAGWKHRTNPCSVLQCLYSSRSRVAPGCGGTGAQQGLGARVEKRGGAEWTGPLHLQPQKLLSI